MRRAITNKTSFGFAIVLTVVLILSTSNLTAKKAVAKGTSESWWQVQSIDTMKYSRDLSREKLRDIEFDQTIEEQIKHIADLGATHVAIGTPYDDEFLPFLKRWVLYARANGLKVWFRGNFSGWEEWFGYEQISRDDHLAKLESFILENPDLFEDGDLFSSCPECENGGPGDPRLNGQVLEHREFLVKEYIVSTRSFSKIGKNVDARYFSMNGDVASLIMDKETTRALGGLVVVDHYVESPEILAQDIKKYAEESGGKVVLGEFGVPIPDIHGNLNKEEQAVWLNSALLLLSEDENLIGLNYWVLTGGSTGLWQNGVKREAVDILHSFYSPKTIGLKVTSSLGFGVKDAIVKVLYKEFKSDRFGNVSIVSPPQVKDVEISKQGYKSYIQSIETSVSKERISLESERGNILFRIFRFLRSLLA
jgi:hypothetical protein